ncbi:MAG: hypothetical protein M3N47_07395 [Chloroflexota bacterium]|nr:hypothetical protein [Chloroflexota bacterium]
MRIGKFREQAQHVAGLGVCRGLRWNIAGHRDGVKGLDVVSVCGIASVAARDLDRWGRTIVTTPQPCPWL